MIVYNLAAEYASLIIICAILISFTRDYNSATLSNRCIKYTYLVVLATVLSTIAAMLNGVPGTGIFHLALAYITNIIYFMLIPSVSVCYLFYTIIITRLKYNERIMKRILFSACIPYTIYLLLLLTNIHNGRIFYITEELGYVRGTWFQLPYILIGINAIIILGFVIKYRTLMHTSSFFILGASTLLAILSIVIQACNPNLIMTGSICTMSILSLHLYIQNVSKSTDQLTHLHNRISLMHHSRQLIKKGENFSLYVFSLRSFKMINERYGLTFGDRVLTHTASIFAKLFKYDMVFRYTGDEFALLLPNNNGQYDHNITELHSKFDQPFTIDGNELYLDVICARVDYGTFGTNIKDLISCADYSISVLKKGEGSRKYLYDTSIVKEILGSNDMVQQLKHAIANDLFEIHYQPIYCVRTRKFVQAEALVRMRKSDGILLYPDKFIDIAERTGLIVPMTYLVLEHVCKDFRSLLDQYSEDLLSLKSISVNFPYLQFITPNMHETVMNILNKYEIPTHRIKIEITERTMISDTCAVSDSMEWMLQKGFVFELDDFGVDYSNMYTFLQLPINIIKLDRSLLLAATGNFKNMNFYKHLASGILATESEIIIEGVETKEQLEFAIDCNCTYIQGFYFSKPLCFNDFKTYIMSTHLIP